MDTFRSYRIHQNEDKKIIAGFEELRLEDLTEGEVVIQTSYSTINYKDALAATGKGRILRKYPLNGGIDLAGTVVSSSDNRFKDGDSVLVVGCGLSEVHDGGYSQIARVPADCVVPMPDGMNELEAMSPGYRGIHCCNCCHTNGRQRTGSGTRSNCGNRCYRRCWQLRRKHAFSVGLRSCRFVRQATA